MAGQHRAETLRGIDGGAFMGVAHPVAQGLTRFHMLGEGRLGHAVLAHHVGAVLTDIGELPLPRRVVHQADDADAVIGPELRQLVDQRVGADLGPQMDDG
jgi:hypothetical protein